MTSRGIPPAILALASRGDELRDLLVRWCAMNSGSGNHTGLATMLEALRAAFSSLPGTVEAVTLPGTPARALRLRVRAGAPLQVLLSGHYDTVYAPDHPFQGCSQSDATTLRGPGVADMKGGLVVMLAALQAFEQTPFARNAGYEVVLGPDEEIGSPGVAALLAECAPRHRLGLVFEPARPNGDLVRTRKGTGRAGVRCHGRAAHAAKPEQGRNAILPLCDFLLQAARVPGALPGVELNVGNIRGGSSAINRVPDFAEAELDVRVTQPSDAPALEARLAQLAAAISARDDVQVECSLTLSRPPKGTGPAEASAFADYQNLARELGLPPFGWQDVAGGSDGNLLHAAGLPTMDGLGPIGDHLHSDREQVHLPSLVSRAQLSALFLHRWAAG